MAEEALLTNTGHFYLSRAEEISEAFKAGRYEESYRLCRRWLEFADLPLLHRATFSMLLATSGTDEEKVLYATQALVHFDKICQEIPGNVDASNYKSLAQNVLNKAIALKAVHEKEAAERRNERSDEETVSYLLERTAIECGQRVPEDTLREVKLALASGQFPGMGVELGPDGNRSVRVKTMKPEERAEMKQKSNFGPKPIGSKRLIQYGKQTRRQPIMDKKWLELNDDDKEDLASNTEKAVQTAVNKLRKGQGASFAYEEDGGLEEQLPPSTLEEGDNTSTRRVKKEPVPTFTRDLTARLANLGEMFGFGRGRFDAAGLPTPAMSQRGDLSVRQQPSDPPTAAQTPDELTAVNSPRTPMRQDGFDTPLSGTPLAYRRKASEGNLKKRVADDETEEEMGAQLKKVKSKEARGEGN